MPIEKSPANFVDWEEGFILRIKAMRGDYVRYCVRYMTLSSCVIGIFIFFHVLYKWAFRTHQWFAISDLLVVGVAFLFGAFMSALIDVSTPRKIRFAPPIVETVQSQWVRRIRRLPSSVVVKYRIVNESIVRIEFWYRPESSHPEIVLGANPEAAARVKEMVERGAMVSGAAGRGGD